MSSRDITNTKAGSIIDEYGDMIGSVSILLGFSSIVGFLLLTLAPSNAAGGIGFSTTLVNIQEIGYALTVQFAAVLSGVGVVLFSNGVEEEVAAKVTNPRAWLSDKVVGSTVLIVAGAFAAENVRKSHRTLAGLSRPSLPVSVSS